VHYKTTQEFFVAGTLPVAYHKGFLHINTRFSIRNGEFIPDANPNYVIKGQ